MMHDHPPCFGPGTHLMTPDGEVPVEWLAAGERLLTRDHGAQPVLWVGRFRISPAEVAENPGLRPVTLHDHGAGPGRAGHPLILSRQHRVLLSGYRVELLAHCSEAFAAAGHLAAADLDATGGIAGGEITYTHVLLPRHEAVLANGIWVESLFLGGNDRRALWARLPRHLHGDRQLLASHRQTARPCLKRWEVQAILGRQGRDRDRDRHAADLLRLTS